MAHRQRGPMACPILSHKTAAEKVFLIRSRREFARASRNTILGCVTRLVDTVRLPAALLLVSCFLSSARGQTWDDFITKTPIGPGETLVVGFMGGREPWDNEERSVRKLALKLRSRRVPGLHFETLENRRRPLAVELVKRAFDRDQDGLVDASERAQARIVVYGLSFGGAAVAKLAQDLHALDFPVLLTVQVDSVGRGDDVIPPNVRRAANFYQKNGIVIQGEGPIRAADPERTTIVADCRVSYDKRKIDISHVNWFKKLMRVAHSYISYDPEVWSRVEQLVLQESAAPPSAAAMIQAPCPSP